MPIHEYKCRSCDAEFEYFARRQDEQATCPKCGGEKLELAFSAFAGRSGRGGDAGGRPR